MCLNHLFVQILGEFFGAFNLSCWLDSLEFVEGEVKFGKF